MSYDPNNTSVWVAASSGAMAGMSASLTQVSYAVQATWADAWAQEVDTLFGAGTPTQLELDAIQVASEAVWSGRSPLPASQSTDPVDYEGPASAVVSMATALNAQAVAEGINPNPGGGGGGGGTSTAATVAGGVSYNVKTTDAIVKMDSSNGEQPVAVLPTPSAVGERHTFFWWAWNAAQVQPKIEAGGANEMSPATGMTSSGSGGLTATTTLTQVGTFATWMWDGSYWMQVA
jgi:hypothetical protein